MQIPKRLAEVVLGCSSIVAIIGSSAAPEIAFGPFFLLICAFGAWFAGNIFAVLLGLFIAVVQVESGHAIALHDGPIVMILQLCSALVVVLMLGVARTALEIEWRFARIDPLTGALNRKAFFEAVKIEASQPGMAVLFFADVDGLKQLNDRIGHEAGDDALRQFADCVRKSIRRNDVFARIGGDEFVIFLRVRDAAAAGLVAQRVNGALNRDPSEGETKLKCSIGVLVLPAGTRRIDSELKQADTLMYHAKKEKLGMTMAIAVDGDVEKILPFSPVANTDRQQNAVIRSSERCNDFESRNELSESSMAA